ncbi:MAG: sulfurtransferase TusA family protein, partial [Terracidiphilus sp.]|nr:sulfurtransferase TusA family protein [Terracidiphilus sp.]
ISNLSDAPLLLSNAVACTGADTCKLGICLPKGALTAVEERLRASDLNLDRIDDFRFNISGCPNSCGQHTIADLGFYGQARRNGQKMYPAYAVVAGAIRKDGEARFAQPIDNISARDLPAFAADFLGVWLEKQQRFNSFAEYIDAEGKQDIQSVCERYRNVPAYEMDAAYYYDWSAKDEFTIVGRGVGECSAGLFDLIGVDLKLIAELRKRLAGSTLPEERADLLYRITLSASRMLLVTRGVEAQSDGAVFESFLHRFIDAGLIDGRFRLLVELARSGEHAILVEREQDVLALAEAVEKLYAGMDNSLRFSTEKADASQAVPKPQFQAERDYRGVACPMNFVRVKLDLSRMNSGERLRILLDDGKPIESVPRSVASEGHKIVAQNREGKHWSVEIEKV